MGDRDAEFTAYVHGRQDHLLRIAVLMCGDVHAAEDLLQEALVKLARHWDRVSTGYPDAYVRRILYNDSVTRWRKHRLEVVTDDLPDLPGVSFGDRWIACADVRRALLLLPTRQRATVVLRYYEELTEAQVATVMQVSIGTVKSQTYAALAAMREHLGPDWGSGGRERRGSVATLEKGEDR